MKITIPKKRTRRIHPEQLRLRFAIVRWLELMYGIFTLPTFTNKTSTILDLRTFDASKKSKIFHQIFGWIEWWWIPMVRRKIMKKTDPRNQSPNISGTYNGGTHLFKLYGYGLCKRKPTPQNSLTRFRKPSNLGGEPVVLIFYLKDFATKRSKSEARRCISFCKGASRQNFCDMPIKHALFVSKVWLQTIWRSLVLGHELSHLNLKEKHHLTSGETM